MKPKFSNGLFIVLGVIIIVLLGLYIFTSSKEEKQEKSFMAEEIIEPEEVIPEETEDIPIMEEPETKSMGQVSIEIKDFNFNPKDIIISTGTTVTWVNKDNVPHKVVAYDRLFYGPRLDPGDSYSFTFTSEGLHSYFDGVFPKSGRGTILVKEEPLPLTGNAVMANLEESNGKLALLVLLFIIMTVALSHGIYSNYKI